MHAKIPYVLIGLFALTILVFGRHRRLRAGLLVLIGVIMLVDTGIAVFHVGVEQHWWAGTPGCGVPTPAATLEEFRARLMATPTVRCDEVQWTLFGISLAGYNVGITLVLALFAFLAARRVFLPRVPPSDVR